MYYTRAKYNHQSDCTGGKRWSDRKRANPYGYPDVITKMKRMGVWSHLVTLSEIIARLMLLARCGASYTWIAPPCTSVK